MLDYPVADVARYWRDTADGRMRHIRKHHAAWSERGTYHRELVARLFKVAGCAGRPTGRVVEWGVGGGMNAAHIRADEYHGVDLSMDSLAEAVVYGVQPIYMDDGDPAAVQLPRDVDLFISTAVFQHFPSKEYARAVLHAAYDCLRVNGLALIQTRFGEMTEPSGDYTRDVTRACVWSVSEFTGDLEDAGFNVLFVERGHADYAYYGAVKYA